jgi:hypothetical protein
MSAYLDKVRDLDTLLTLVREHERQLAKQQREPHAVVSTANADVVGAKVRKLPKAS